MLVNFGNSARQSFSYYSANLYDINTNALIKSTEAINIYKMYNQKAINILPQGRYTNTVPFNAYETKRDEISLFWNEFGSFKLDLTVHLEYFIIGQQPQLIKENVPSNRITINVQDYSGYDNQYDPDPGDTNDSGNTVVY